MRPAASRATTHQSDEQGIFVDLQALGGDLPSPAEATRRVHQTYVVNIDTGLDQANCEDEATQTSTEYEIFAGVTIRECRDSNIWGMCVDPRVILQVSEFVGPGKVDILQQAIIAQSFVTLLAVFLLNISMAAAASELLVSDTEPLAACSTPSTATDEGLVEDAAKEA